MTVSTRRDGHVAIVTFAVPPNNHVSVGLLRELADLFEALDGDRDIRATVLTSEGKVFCAGADLAPPGEDGPELNTLKLYEQAARLFGVAKPMIAAVQGAAVGAGLGLALVADFRIAAPEARFVANFVKLGFHPGFGISHSLPRLIGEQRAARMLLTGERVGGEAALRLGLVDEVMPLDGLLDAAIALAASIAENAPLAVQATRATLRTGLVAAIRARTDIEAAEQATLMATADFAEGVRAVRERRAGNFTGE